MPEGFHPPVEEYLKVAYEPEEDGIPVIRARLAERLAHSAPAVTEVVRRLAADGYLEVCGRSLQLTIEGRRLAEGVVRKHRLAERLLVDVIGLPWYKVHAEASNWEHVISQEAEDRLLAVLGHPSTCPHGNPIPGSATLPSLLRPLADTQPRARRSASSGSPRRWRRTCPPSSTSTPTGFGPAPQPPWSTALPMAPSAWP